MKVTFDAPNKRIVINPAITQVDVRADLYSAWKVWVRTDDNMKYAKAFRSIGGEAVNATQSISPTYFLTNGWRVRPWEANHTLTVVGNLYTDENDAAILPTIGAFNVVVNMSTSVNVLTIATDGAVINENTLAAAVWANPTRELTGGGVDAATIAKIDALTTSVGILTTGMTGLTATTDTISAGVTGVDTDVAAVQSAVTAIAAQMTDLLDIELGEWEIVNNQMIFRRPNGVELARFNLRDASNAPTTTKVFRRVPL